MQTGEIDNTTDPDQLIDDDEPIYDRLRERGGGSISKPRSPTQTQKRQQESMNFRRMKGPSRATRESVLHLADDMKERSFTQSLTDPQPMEHTVSEVDITSPIQLTTSFQLPDHKPHTAAPLAPRHRRNNSNDMKKDLSRRPTIEVTSPLTPKGTVSRITKKFSFNPTSSRIPGPSPRHGSSPLKATASTSEMTKSNIPVKSNVSDTKMNDSEENTSPNNVKIRSSVNRRSGGKTRPASFDVALLLNNEKNVIETCRDDSALTSDDIEVGNFNRNTQARKPFRKRTESRELSPEADEDDIKATEPVPRSPTTGALISDNVTFMTSDEIPEYNELLAMEMEEKKLSQNTGSQSSQDSIRNPKLTVRERTQRWEARGTGLPSYFSTLPKSFRHKATDRRRDPAYTYAPQYPGMEEDLEEDLEFCPEDPEEYEEMMRKVSRASISSKGSQSGIPIPTSKFRPPRSSMPTGASGSLAGSRGDLVSRREKSLSPTHGKEERSLNSSGQYTSSNESSLERRMGVGQDGDVAGRKMSAGKGGSMLPKRSTFIQVRT